MPSLGRAGASAGPAHCRPWHLPAAITSSGRHVVVCPPQGRSSHHFSSRVWASSGGSGAFAGLWFLPGRLKASESCGSPRRKGSPVAGELGPPLCSRTCPSVCLEAVSWWETPCLPHQEGEMLVAARGRNRTAKGRGSAPSGEAARLFPARDGSQGLSDSSALIHRQWRESGEGGRLSLGSRAHPTHPQRLRCCPPARGGEDAGAGHRGPTAADGRAGTRLPVPLPLARPHLGGVGLDPSLLPALGTEGGGRCAAQESPRCSGLPALMLIPDRDPAPWAPAG